MNRNTLSMFQKFMPAKHLFTLPFIFKFLYWPEMLVRYSQNMYILVTLISCLIKACAYFSVEAYEFESDCSEPYSNFFGSFPTYRNKKT